MAYSTALASRSPMTAHQVQEMSPNSQGMNSLPRHFTTILVWLIDFT